jgi:hypothetical protein
MFNTLFTRISPNLPTSQNLPHRDLDLMGDFIGQKIAPVLNGPMF